MPKQLKRRISNRHALIGNELMFVRIYVAFGEDNAPEAYRRAYLSYNDDDELWYPRKANGDGDFTKTPLDPKQCYRKAKALLDADHIQSYIAELRESAGDLARQQLSDTMLFTDEKLSMQAAERVLDDEDKLGFRDAVEQWAEIMCAVGAEVVVLLPDGTESVTPLRNLIPAFKDSAPPRDVIERSILSLQDYRDRLPAVDPA
jgi:hypothetical protein